MKDSKDQLLDSVWKGTKRPDEKKEKERRTLDVLRSVSLLGSRDVRETKMNSLVLGVVRTGKGDGGEDVEGELAVWLGVVDRLVLATRREAEEQCE
jgi:hypothetical protein